MDSIRQDPSGTNSGSAGGRTAVNLLEIDWKSRAESIWDVHSTLRRSITELWNIALGIDQHTIGSYEDFRRKFNKKRPASEAHAKVLFAAGEFDRAGVSIAEWIASDEDWAISAASLSPVDAVGYLAERVDSGVMQVAASSIPQRERPEWRRLQDGDPAENELHVKEYLQLTVTFPGSQDPAPVHLLAFEWSAVSRDWQIFNLVKTSLLDVASPVPVALRGGTAIAQVPVGVKITGPLETFDLFVLAQKTPFDHRALSYLENLNQRSVVSSLEMGRLVDLLFKGRTVPDVATTSYAVVE